MERLAQYLDDVDDLLGIVALCSEHIRRLVLRLVRAVVFGTAIYGGVQIARIYPPAAGAVATVLLILLVYRSLVAAKLAVARS